MDGDQAERDQAERDQAERDQAALARASRGGVCAGCRCASLVRAASGALYLRCRHPALPKYPPMPVVRCAHLTPRGRDGTPSGEGS